MGINNGVEGVREHMPSEKKPIEARLEEVYAASESNFKKDPIEQNTYLVGGELREASQTDPITTPLTEEGTYGSAPSLTADEAKDMLEACKSAWQEGTGQWPMSSIPERVETVRAFLEDMKTIREEVVTDLMYEIAKNRADAEKEFDRTVEYIEQTCLAVLKLTPVYEEHPGGLNIITNKIPLGETLCMSPYNYPLNETFTTFLPALVMGNPTILKPARHGVLFRRHFATLFQKHFPAGVVNIAYGDGATVVTPMMQTGDIDALAFIGSGKVAKIIAGNHPNRLALREVDGLGAKNPYIITKSADLDKSVKDVLVGALSYNGQRCTANKITFIAREIYEVFMSKLKDEVEKLTLGMPYGWYTTVHDDEVRYDPNVIPAITPFPEPGKVAAMKAYIDDAVEKGATIVNKDGGKAFHKLMVPAILAGVTANMRIYHEEQFGSVLPTLVFDGLEEPIRRIRQSEYGQQTSIYSQDPKEIKYFYDAISTQQGRININSMCQRGPDNVAFSAAKGGAVGELSIDKALIEFSTEGVVAEIGNLFVKVY